MKLIIAGSRNARREHVEEAMSREGTVPFHEIRCTLSGKARGADKHGEDWARDHGLMTLPFPADWGRYGPRLAGFIRNEEMAQAADALMAVWDGQSNGTADMIARAKAHNLRIWIYNYRTQDWVME